MVCEFFRNQEKNGMGGPHKGVEPDAVHRIQGSVGRASPCVDDSTKGDSKVKESGGSRKYEQATFFDPKVYKERNETSY